MTKEPPNKHDMCFFLLPLSCLTSCQAALPPPTPLSSGNIALHKPSLQSGLSAFTHTHTSYTGQQGGFGGWGGPCMSD